MVFKEIEALLLRVKKEKEENESSGVSLTFIYNLIYIINLLKNQQLFVVLLLWFIRTSFYFSSIGKLTRSDSHLNKPKPSKVSD